MKLTLLYESGRSREFVKQLRKLLRSKGPRAVYDKYNITADQLSEILGMGAYGEHDIKDKELHRIRAPQNIYKLMQYFNVDSNIIKKLVKFYKEHKSQINTHRPSPSNEEAIRQLNNDERLVAMVNIEFINSPLKEKYHIELVKWLPTEYEIYYISKHPDMIEALEKAATKSNLEKDLMQGLMFGYPWALIYNFVRNNNEDLVNSICGEAMPILNLGDDVKLCVNSKCGKINHVPGSNFCVHCGKLLHKL